MPSLVKDFISSKYKRCLNQPLMVLLMVLVITSISGYYAQFVSFDMSSDSLVAQDDPELSFFRETNKQFSKTDSIIMTYSPNSGKLLSKEPIHQLIALKKSLEKLEGVASVTSLLDAPLLKSPPIPISQLSSGYKTIASPNVRLDLAEKELTTSPLFKNLLISPDGKTTALSINLSTNTKLTREQYLQQRSQLLNNIRQIKTTFSDKGTLYIGGVPMIASDIMDYVQADIKLYGILIFSIVSFMLYLFFRQIRWVIIPIGTCAGTITIVLGFLGFTGQPITAISSNFISLLVIINIAFSVHLISRYRELQVSMPEISQTERVYQTMQGIFFPCLYTALTTIVAFGSLMTSHIVPVDNFGLLMCFGVFVSFMMTFSFFAVFLLLMQKGSSPALPTAPPKITVLLSHITLKYTNWILLAAFLSIGVAILGIQKINLNNRFIDYFKSNTEIHLGMVFIDEQLGGTMPFDVILSFPPFKPTPIEEEDDFADSTVDPYPERYWFTPDKLAKLKQLHQYIDARTETGKVLSIASLNQIAEDFNNGNPLDSLQIAAVLGAVPANVRTQLIDGFADPKQGKMRISIRVRESGPSFSREAFLDDIHRYAMSIGFADNEVHSTGIMVLFNNMINKLLSSQVSTLGFVILLTLIMLIILLRSLPMAIIGLIPNSLAAITIIAIMGFVGIPLDMMTITIASISIGIGVDDAIHYLHRFQHEYKLNGGDARDAIQKSHQSTGQAIYFTSFTVIAGFSILSCSNFVPTIYFGLLTALAMLLALTANLTILPSLLLKVYERKSITPLNPLPEGAK